MEYDYVLDGTDYSETRHSIQAKLLVVADNIEEVNEDYCLFNNNLHNLFIWMH